MPEKQPLFNRLNHVPAYKVVADALQSVIMAKRIKPGDALPTEGELAKQFGVNRSTVREGIRHMEQTGLVTRQGKKLIVSKPSYDQVSDQFSKALIVHDVTFQELWQVKMALEPLSASLAATNATDSQLQKLEKNIEITKTALTSEKDIIDLDIEFHELVSYATGNTALVMARGALARLFYHAYQVDTFPEQASQRLLDAHVLIFNAIQAHDKETAYEWMRKHIVDFKRGYEMAGLNPDSPVVYPLFNYK